MSFLTQEFEGYESSTPANAILIVRRLKMTTDDLQNELDTPLIGDSERVQEERHSPTSNSTSNPSPMANASRDISFNEAESTTTESSPKLLSTNQSANHCHHHLCHNGDDAHAHQHRNFHRSRHIEPSETARAIENSQQNQNHQNIYTNHPDDQSDSDDTPNAPKLPNRPQMMKLPCRNRCTCHERHHQIQHQNNT